VSTLSEREAALRRALQNAAASIEPAPDGLERIQARLQRPRPLAIAWLEAAWTDFYLRARAGLQTAGPLLAQGMRHVWQRFGPDSVPDRGRALRWLRPLAALSLAVFVVAAGTYVGLNGSTLFTVGTGANSRTLGSGATSPVGTGRGKPEGSSASPGPASSQPQSSATTPECTKTPKPAHYKAPTSSTSSSPSSTAPPSSPPTSPSPTPTSPSPTPTDDTSPTTTPNPAATTAATGADNDGSTAGSDSTPGTSQPDAAVKSAADHASGTSSISTGTSTPTSRRHAATPSATPCPSNTTAALTRPAGLTLRQSGAITLASAQLTPARLTTTVVAAGLNDKSEG
jgi:hypothetical protein